MHIFLVGFQAVILIACFAFITVISRQRSSSLVTTMLNIGYCAMVMNAGYLLELLADSRERAMTAVCAEYVGAAFAATYFLLFICDYCRVSLSARLKYILFAVGYAVIAIVWTWPYHKLYFSSIEYVDTGIGPHLALGYGKLYAVFSVLYYLELVAGLVISFVSMLRIRDRWMRGNYFAVFSGAAVVAIYPLFFRSDAFLGYNPIPCGMGLGMIIGCAALVQRNAFNLINAARDAVVNNLDTGIVVVNNQLEYEDANPKAMELFPYLQRFTKGTKLDETEIFPLFEETGLKEFMQEGRNFDVHVNELCSQGQVVGRTAAFIDVTRNKQQIEEMRELQEQAEVANQAKSRFLANMSHEIRTPINAILGMNEMILREAVAENVRRYAMDVKTSAAALLGIVNEVLDFSKIESGKLELLPIEYDICSVLNDLSTMITMKARSKNLLFEMEIDKELPVGLFGDDIRLRQILTNLLTNAVKYTEKGTVTLRVSGTEKDNMEYLHFEVEDTGIGIPKEDIPKLFSAFERIEEKRNRSIEGTGLGMNITVNLLDLMDSRLNVESEYGKGSIFSFDLCQRILNHDVIGDFEERMKQQVLQYDSYNDYIAPDAKILVVDDNQFNRNVFRNLLKRTKIQVTDLGSGADCLELVKKEHFDIIFMDHMMPEMDGIETFQSMQKLEDNVCRNTPVVMLTANVVMGAREQYLEYGFDAFLSKPVDPDKLEHLIEELLPKELLLEADWESDRRNNSEADSHSSEEDVKLPEIEGVDWRHAQLFFANKQHLLEAACDYAKALDREEQVIGEAYERIAGSSETAQGKEQADSKNALDTYRIHVHSMKSSSAMVGNLTLSSLAKCLEGMAREEDIAGIRRLHDVFAKELAESKKRFSVLLPERENVEREPISRESLLSMLDLMEMHMEDLDVDAADDLMQVLDGYAYEEPVAEYMEELRDAVENLDAEAAVEAVHKIRDWGE